MRALCIVFAAFTMSACGPKLDWQYLNRYQLLREARSTVFPSEEMPPAVVLSYEQQYLMYTTGRGQPYTQRLEHRAVLILSEKGLNYASVRFSVHEDIKVVNFSARTISPDGQVQFVREEQLIEDQATVGGDDYRIRVMQFPAVEVGSIIEYSLLMEETGLYSSMHNHITEKIPIKKYSLDLSLAEPLVYDFELYNSTVPISTSTSGGMNMVSFTIRDVPATSDESMSPSSLFSEPWWFYRTKQYRYGKYVRNSRLSWPSVVESYGGSLYNREDKVFGDFDGSMERGDCGDNLCLTQKAWASVREKIQFTGFKKRHSSRALAKVVESAHGSGFEKSYYLWHLLDEVGVEAKLGLVGRRFTRWIEKESPSMIWFNHLVVYVPKQKGLERDLWLDPSCEYCEPGELPPWLVETEALVMTPNFGGRRQVRTEFRKISGGQPEANRELYHYQVNLADNGDAKVSLTVEEHGTNALWSSAKRWDWSAEDWQKLFEEEATSRHSTALVQSTDKVRCNKANGRCQHGVSFTAPGYATLRGDDMMVSLGFFENKWSKIYTDPKRTHHIVINDNTDFEERVVIATPSGYATPKLPENEKKETDAFGYSLEFQAEPNQVVVVRKLWSKVGRFSKKDYKKHRQLISDFRKTRQAVLLFNKVKDQASSAPGEMTKKE